MKSISWIRVSLRAGLIAVAILSGKGYAQPVLNVTRVVNNWPTIEVHYTVSCNGQTVLGQAGTMVTVREDGIPMTTLSSSCPDPSVTYSLSVALVFDASGSMGGGNANTSAIQAGLSFVSKLDGVIDEAAVLWFNNAVTLEQTMTKSKTALQNAINKLPASGGTAVWDGIYAGLLEVIQSGTNLVRAVIVLTDGDDNSSTRTPTEIISLATRNRIRVFTIGLGNLSGSLGDLTNIAGSTGGQFYSSPTTATLTQIYNDIATLLKQGAQECLVSYHSQCMDGLRRTVELTATLSTPCSGTDVKTRTFTAPRDTTTLTPVRITMDTLNGDPGALISVPVRLLDPVPGMLKYGTFRFVLSKSVASYAGIVTAGGLLEGAPISVDQKQDTVILNVLQPTTLLGKGILFQLSYRMAARIQSRVCSSSIELSVR